MLDACIGQAAGLQGAGLRMAPCMIALASHCERRHELPVLWELCAAVVAAGYTLAVLDASTAESSGNPGLAQLLGPTPGIHDWMDGRAPWAVIPAATGLGDVPGSGSGPEPSLRQLGDALHPFGVVILYAGAQSISSLLNGTEVEPVLVLPASKASVVSAYQALKQLLLRGGLKAVLASLEPDAGSSGSATEAAAYQALQNCASNFLGFRPEALAVNLEIPGQPAPLETLALRMMENAVQLPRSRPDLNWQPRSGGRHGIVGGH